MLRPKYILAGAGGVLPSAKLPEGRRAALRATGQATSGKLFSQRSGNIASKRASKMLRATCARMVIFTLTRALTARRARPPEVRSVRNCRFTTYRHRFERVAPAPRAKLIQRIVDARRSSTCKSTWLGEGNFDVERCRVSVPHCLLLLQIYHI